MGRRVRQLTHLFYSRKFRKGFMTDVTVIDFSRLGQRQMLTAEAGEWNEARALWEFYDGHIVNIDDENGHDNFSQFRSLSLPAQS